MAAKAIQISSDGGTLWYSLPGSQGAFDVEGESIDDTILGAIYKSSEIGLESWKVSSDAIFKGFAGYKAELKRVGTPTTMTSEAMTLVSGKTYKITNAAKEIWDRSQALTFNDGGLIAVPNILNIDYLFGQVTFIASYTPAGAVTVTGKYFPTAAAGCANSYTLTMSADAIDESCFSTVQANNGTRIYRSGLKTVALELTGIFNATENFKSILIARSEIIIEIDPAGDGSSVARGFFKLSTTGQSGAVGALEEEKTSWMLQVPDVTNNAPAKYPFSWRHTATTMSLAIQKLLTSWLDGLNTYEVRYLPQGAITQTPLDGIEGAFVVTDVSLSGGLSNMNTFQASLQGTGQYVEV
jgi:hypothetical protein